MSPLKELTRLRRGGHNKRIGHVQTREARIRQDKLRQAERRSNAAAGLGLLPARRRDTNFYNG
jgi:hypothetical protein